MSKTPDSTPSDLQTLWQNALQQPLTSANYGTWRDRINSLPEDQKEQVARLWDREVAAGRTPPDGSLNWAIPLLDQKQVGSGGRQVLQILERMPETLRHEFWMTALEVCDCWTPIADQYGAQLVSVLLPILRKAAQTSTLSDAWWIHWIAGVRALLAVRAGDVATWAPNVHKLLVASHPPELVKKSPLMTELAAVSTGSTADTTKKGSKGVVNKKESGPKKSAKSPSTMGSPATDVWKHLRNVIDQVEKSSRKERDDLQSQVRILDNAKAHLMRERDELQRKLDEARRDHEEMRASNEKLMKVHEQTTADVTRLRAEVAAEIRKNRDLQSTHRELADLQERTKDELAGWQRTAELREHEVQTQRNALELEFRDQLRRGPVRLAAHVKDYLESLLTGDPNPELVPLVGLSFDDLHRSLLGISDLPHDARIRRELLTKPEGT